MLVRDLLRPGAYPAPRPRRVTLATTHISWVLVTEDEVWKVKRPVRYAFLDFATARRRRRACREEVRLGRRLAPDVYLGVVPVRRGPRGYSFAGSGAVVDHAVRMRRLPDADRALDMLRDGALGHAHLGRLARLLAEFYVSARATPSYGRRAVIARNVRENFDEVRDLAGELRVFRQSRDFQVGFLEDHGDRLVARQAAGRIRDGHGDLRLEHVYHPARSAAVAPIVLDPVEFAARFRCGDVALDVAFFAMDLDFHGRADLGRAFLARFAEASGDFDLYGVADFYLSYRAWVRGKIACLLAHTPGVPPGRAGRKAIEAERLFALARAYAHGTAGTPHVIAVGGLPGSGKSTLAAQLGERLCLPVVSSDRTRKALAGVPASSRAPERFYSDVFSRRTQDEMIRRAEVVAASGRSVVLDATFRSPEARAAARALAARSGSVFAFVEAVCDEAELARRVRSRAAGPSDSDADADVLARVRATYTPPGELPAGERFAADTTAGTEGAATAVAGWLESTGVPAAPPRATAGVAPGPAPVPRGETATGA